MIRFLLPLFFVSASLYAVAQGFYNKGSIVSLSSQALLTVPDSLLNTGTLVNNGDLRISGAWINLGTYEAGIGKINFNSNLTQTINHNDQAFGKLTINGTGEKRFLANITVQSELDLQSSILKSSNGAKIILEQNAVVSGGSNQSHVVGPVEVKGSGDWLFPIGNGTTYLPVEIIGVTDPAARGTLTLNELATAPATSQALRGAADLAKLSSKRYWQFVAGGGNLTSSVIKLPLVDEDGLTDNLDLLVVAGSNNATELYESLGKSGFTGDLKVGSITSEQAPTASFYSIAALTGDTRIGVYNGISAGSDGKNDYLQIRNIHLYPNNRVLIFNRWGDRVFEIVGYDNDQKSFRGDSNVGGSNRLPSGTYFYSIDLGDGSKKATGYLQVK